MSDTLHRNKNRRRPTKNAAEKARRVRTQKGRLIALGMTEAQVAKMSDKEVRTALKRPKKIVAAQ